MYLFSGKTVSAASWDYSSESGNIFYLSESTITGIYMVLLAFLVV